MTEKSLLVIGGAGFVGSHFVLFARNAGFHVTVMDNLSTGHLSALRGHEFVKMDLSDGESFRRHLVQNRYDGIFHFAASSLVPESVENPAEYYRNNVVAAHNMLEAMRLSNHDRLVFSSTSAIYGDPEAIPIREDHPKNPLSPYARTKLVIEWMLEDYHHAYGLRSASLRYFNAAGCEPKQGLGEDRKPESHLIPNIVRYALKLDQELTIFGDDYDTPDGTCVRDYIHVTDLAEAHVAAWKRLHEAPLMHLNLGTGSGFSNLEVVRTVGKVLGVKLEPTMGKRRPGDSPKLVADSSAAFKLLGWKPNRSSLEKIVSDVVEWFSGHPAGYPD